MLFPRALLSTKAGWAIVLPLPGKPVITPVVGLASGFPSAGSYVAVGFTVLAGFSSVRSPGRFRCQHGFTARSPESGLCLSLVCVRWKRDMVW